MLVTRDTYIKIIFSLLLLAFCTPIHGGIRKEKTTVPARVGSLLYAPDALPNKAPADEGLRSSPTCIAMKRIIYQGARSDVEGIDVSHYQGNINWHRVATSTDIAYSYVKCSQGATLQDNRYQENVREARRAGIPVGAYHYYSTKATWEAQLANMTSVAHREDMDLVPMIDIEERGREPLDIYLSNLKSFIKAVANHYRCTPLLYTGQNFYNKYLSGILTNSPWMIAKYSEPCPQLTDNTPYMFWQYSDKEHVEGIAGYVDKSCLMQGHSLKDIYLNKK